MQRYDSYKPSGVKWLGEILGHWEVLPLKRIVDTYPGATPATSNANNWDGTIPWITPADFKTDTKYVNNGSRSITLQGLKSCSAKLVPTNSVIMSKRAPVGQLSIATQPLCTNQGCISCVSRSMIKPMFLFYLLSVYKETFESFSGGTTFKELSLQSFNDFRVSLPPLFEQEAIANYLDAATAKIDAAIAQQQKMIDLLNERKQIIINRAVTKGLNPNAKMKDSGVEWIGEVPEGWEVRKLKHIAKLQSGDTISSDNFTEAGYPVFGGNGFRGYTNRYTNDGDYVLIGRQGALCGNVNYAHGQFFASEHAVVVYPYNKENLVWLGEVIRASNLNQYSQSAAQPGLAVSLIQNIYYPYPPKEEREVIATCIEKNINKINGAIDIVNRQISLLQERKQIIINEVVTGKVKVG